MDLTKVQSIRLQASVVPVDVFPLTIFEKSDIVSAGLVERCQHLSHARPSLCIRAEHLLGVMLYSEELVNAGVPLALYRLNQLKELSSCRWGRSWSASDLLDLS